MKRFSEPQGCNQTYFPCPDNTSQCIPWPWVCDKDPDCTDDSDESRNLCNNVGKCGVHFNATTPSGLLTSPHFPNNYPEKYLGDGSQYGCIYTISQPVDTYMNLTFRMLEVHKTYMDVMELMVD